MSNLTERQRFPFARNGALIRSFRKRVGKSQEKLAIEVGTTRRHMIRLENGEHLPSSDLRNRIAAATGREPEEIQSSEDEEESPLPPRSLADDLLRLSRVAALMESRPEVIEDILAVGHDTGGNS